MKNGKIILSIGLFLLVVFIFLAYNIITNLLEQNHITETNNKARAILLEQEPKIEHMFNNNQVLFKTVAEQIEKLPISITEISIFEEQIVYIRKDGISVSGLQQPIGSISDQLEIAVKNLEESNIKCGIEKSSDSEIVFSMFSDSDGACFYGITLIYSKKAKMENEYLQKLRDNWYLEKNILWGT